MKILICIFMLFLLPIGCKFVCKDDFVIESDEKSLLEYSELLGQWVLKYPQNYGYEFIFSDDYNAEITLNLNTAIIKFKGKFLLEDNRRIRIFLSEMMQKDEITHGNKFMLEDSYFLFNGRIIKSETLVLNPISIITHGRNSDGYFEPQIRLKKQ